MNLLVSHYRFLGTWERQSHRLTGRNSGRIDLVVFDPLISAKYSGRINFSAYFFAFFKGKETAYFGQVEAKIGKREGAKRTTKIGHAFLCQKVHFFPGLKQSVA